jgi:hypothetical protein
MDRRLVRIAFVALIILTSSWVPARAECGLLSLETTFANNAVVFVGRAIDRKSSRAQDPKIITETTFEVETVWKGPLASSIRVTTCGGTVGTEGVSCSEAPKFTVGSKYVVFAKGEPLTASGCAGTDDVALAGLTLEWLSDKPHTTVR